MCATNNQRPRFFNSRIQRSTDRDNTERSRSFSARSRSQPRKMVSETPSLFLKAKTNVDSKQARFCDIDQERNVIYFPNNSKYDEEVPKGIIFNSEKQNICNSIPYILEEHYSDERIKKLNLENDLSNYYICKFIEGSCVRLWYDPTGKKWKQSTNRSINSGNSEWKDQSFDLKNFISSSNDTFDNIMTGLDSQLNREYVYFFWISKSSESRNIISYDDEPKCLFLYAQHRIFNHDTKDYVYSIVDDVKFPNVELLPRLDNFKSYSDIKKSIDEINTECVNVINDYMNALKAKNDDKIEECVENNPLKTFSGVFLIDKRSGKCVKIVPHVYVELRGIVGNEPTIFYRFLKLFVGLTHEERYKFIYINYNKRNELFIFIKKFLNFKSIYNENFKNDNDFIVEKNAKNNPTNLTINLDENTSVTIKNFMNYI